MAPINIPMPTLASGLPPCSTCYRVQGASWLSQLLSPCPYLKILQLTNFPPLASRSFVTLPCRLCALSFVFPTWPPLSCLSLLVSFAHTLFPRLPPHILLTTTSSLLVRICLLHSLLFWSLPEASGCALPPTFS